MTIWKVPIPLKDHFDLELPHNHRILLVDVQFDEPYMWILVDPVIPRILHHFILVQTGEDFTDVAQYCGTFHTFTLAIQPPAPTSATDFYGKKPIQQTWHLFRMVS